MFAVPLLTLIISSFASNPDFDSTIEIIYENLQPETAIYSDDYGWLVSSKGQGPIFKLELSDSGTYYEPKVFFDHANLNQSTGFRLENDKLYVCNTNSVTENEWYNNITTPLVNVTTASLFVKDLGTNETKEYRLDDAPPPGYNGTNMMHFCNDMAVTEEGDVYLTDSFQGVVYKLALSTDDADDAEFTVFSENEEWVWRTSFGPNGIALNDDETFLMITIYYTSTIWKVSLTDGSNYEVNKDVQNIPTGMDGQEFSTNGKSMYTIQNVAHLLYEWETNNEWDNVTLKNTYSSRYGGCTAVTVIKGRKYPYIANSFLGQTSRTQYYIEEARFASSGSGSTTKNKGTVTGLAVGFSIAACLLIVAILFIVKKNRDTDGSGYNQM